MKYNFLGFTNRVIVCACTLLMFACGMGDDNNTNPNDKPEEEVGDDNSNTPNEDTEDLSYLYLLSRSEQTEYYTPDGSVVIKTPEYKMLLSYEGHKIIKSEWYVNGNLEATEHYTYDGLTATVTDDNGAVIKIIEYADDTYKREKYYEEGDLRRVSIYDGVKLVNRKEYSKGKLVYDEVYVYDGLTATVVVNRYTTDGVLEYTLDITRTYIDETFLRVGNEETYYTDDYESRHSISTYVYDGTKLIMSESKFIDPDGKQRISSRDEREYDGLKCRKKYINYNTNDGSILSIMTSEIEYLE